MECPSCHTLLAAECCRITPIESAPDRAAHRVRFNMWCENCQAVFEGHALMALEPFYIEGPIAQFTDAATPDFRRIAAGLPHAGIVIVHVAEGRYIAGVSQAVKRNRAARGLANSSTSTATTTKKRGRK